MWPNVLRLPMIYGVTALMLLPILWTTGVVQRGLTRGFSGGLK